MCLLSSICEDQLQLAFGVWPIGPMARRQESDCVSRCISNSNSYVSVFAEDGDEFWHGVVLVHVDEALGLEKRRCHDLMSDETMRK